MDPKHTEHNHDEINPGQAGAGPVHQCPFGNGDSYRQGIRWIQATTDRLVHLEENVEEIKNSGASTASRVEEVRQEIKFWARIVAFLTGVPVIIVAILKIISEIQAMTK